MSDARSLIILRGNSGAGKSAVARAVRDAYGRGCALVEQDHLRRIVLREHDTGGLAPRLIVETTRVALEGGYHVVLEGILPSGHYGEALRDLTAAHGGPSFEYYLAVSLEESLRRHRTRPAADFGPEQMRDWYQADDLLGTPGELVIPQTSPLERSIEFVLHTSGLRATGPASWCPISCPRCRSENANGRPGTG